MNEQCAGSIKLVLLRLERSAAKVACCVLRGRGLSNAVLLPDIWRRDVPIAS